jgi:hypothetical protein
VTRLLPRQRNPAVKGMRASRNCENAADNPEPSLEFHRSDLQGSVDGSAQPSAMPLFSQLKRLLDPIKQPAHVTWPVRLR